ncbi:MAG: DUF58 domain-containing protein [Planctomycetota bacterium]
MYPGTTLLRWVTGTLLLLVASLFLPWDRLGAFGVVLVFVLVGLTLIPGLFALGQAWFSGWAKVPEVERILPISFALGRPGTAILRFTSNSPRRQEIEWTEDVPAHVQAEGLPQTLVLEPGKVIEVRYSLTAMRRGDQPLGPVHLRFTSPGGWLQCLRRAGAASTMRVFPDYAPVVRYALMALQGQVSATGIRRRRVRGMGLDFHQLRDYREGDAITTVDWKATARRTKLIVRDYQEERNQRILFLVDCGHRMRAVDEGLPLLDHALNALLLVSYVALRQGDRVSLTAFGGRNDFIGGVQGTAGMSQVLRTVYTWQSTPVVADMEGAARQVLAREPRRSLVVILSNLRPEDRTDIERAWRVLGRRHLVLIAIKRERAVDALLKTPPQTSAGAWQMAAAAQYEDQRSQLIADLRARGMHVLDLLPQQLPVALASEYLDIKASTRL